jgi:hypothetical protein
MQKQIAFAYGIAGIAVAIALVATLGKTESIPKEIAVPVETSPSVNVTPFVEPQSEMPLQARRDQDDDRRGGGHWEEEEEEEHEEGREGREHSRYDRD